ncbi:MAG: ABC transporter permease, partial [Anaeroplasmataceae bacterium]|nr:ABC transporter permease [Anaeroplasmataceae bacterium]
MVKYAIKRILLMLLTFFIIMLICFVLIKALPLKDLSNLSPDQRKIIEQSREARGYGKPVLEQFFIFWKQALKGDWGVGEEYLTGQPVGTTFLKMLPATMLVNIFSIVLSIPLGILLGVFAALKKNKWQDHFISTGVMIFISVPSF